MNLHEKIKEVYEKGVFGSMYAVECTFEYAAFVPKGDVEYDSAYSQMAEVFENLMLKSDHMTFNPVNDELVKMGTSSFLEAIKIYLQKNSTTKYDEVDNNNDYVKITSKMMLIFGNLLPILDQEKLRIVEASVITPIAPVKIEV